MAGNAKSHSVCFDFQKVFHSLDVSALPAVFRLLCVRLAAHSFAVHSVLGS